MFTKCMTFYICDFTPEREREDLPQQIKFYTFIDFVVLLLHRHAQGTYPPFKKKKKKNGLKVIFFSSSDFCDSIFVVKKFHFFSAVLSSSRRLVVGLSVRWSVGPRGL